MKGKIMKVDGNKITIRPNENFMNIQIDKNHSSLEEKLGTEVDISFGYRTGKAEVLVNGCYYDGFLID